MTRAILFTDLVDSTALLSRIGQVAMERVRREHFRLMRAAIADARGTEVKTVGDAFMAAFDNGSDAVTCGIAMQIAQRTKGREQRLNGVAMRVGVSFGEVDEEDGDFFGIPVVEAARLCAKAEGGQVLVADFVRMLARGALQAFRSVGSLELKGLPEPVAASEAVYELPSAEPFLTRTPFVGRPVETARLREKLALAVSGQGGVVMLVGEPGIGKTRMIEQFCDDAVADGAVAIGGRCFEGEWAPPFGPFVEALSALSKLATPAELRADMGYGAAALARLVPAIGEARPETLEPTQLTPNEEHFRILDAVRELLLAQAKRRPLVLVLDDLHWADAGSLAMLRHCARRVRGSGLLIIGAYRDVELDRQHPLAEALQQLRREAEYERIVLRGLDAAAVREMISLAGEQEADPAFVQAISDETGGNPFFIRETLLHLVEEGKLVQERGQWRSTVSSIEELSIPEGVRQVVGRRLSRLSEAANRLLTASSAFSGPFAFSVAAAGAGIDDDSALDAIDEALSAQLVRASVLTDTYEFSHALVRHTLYSEMNPSRQVRLHRKLAESLESASATARGSRETPGTPASAAEIAYQYHRSVALPGGERGVAWALRAADDAESSYAWEKLIASLDMARELAPESDPRLGPILRRLALALPYVRGANRLDAALEDATALTATAEGNDAGADFVSQAVTALADAGRWGKAMSWAPRGLELMSPRRRDEAWARLAHWEMMRRSSETSEEVGIVLPADDLAELWPIASKMDRGAGTMFALSAARFASVNDIDAADEANIRAFIRGNYREQAAQAAALSARSMEEGRFETAASTAAIAARCLLALGELREADGMRERADEAAGHVSSQGVGAGYVITYLSERQKFVDEDWEGFLSHRDRELSGVPGASGFGSWNAAAIRAYRASAEARVGNVDYALELVRRVQRAVELAPGNAVDYPLITHEATEALWLTRRTDHAENLERNIRTKVVAGGFTYPSRDGRLSLARLCALQGRLIEAREAFAEARIVLEKQGARPLRAICDYDEALALVRDEGRGLRDAQFPSTPRELCETLLDAALAQFRELGMTGWVRRAEALRAGGRGP
ncbi:MAG: AAA family ATPase [Dehalococcoidia bacterium]